MEAACFEPNSLTIPSAKKALSHSLSNQNRRAAMFEFLARAADTGLFQTRERYGGVDKIPAPVNTHKSRVLIMLLPPLCGVKRGRKMHLGMVFAYARPVLMYG